MGYGFQLQLDKGTGDLVLSGLKRLPRVTAEEKVKQDLRILLRTVKGEDIFNPDFGFDVLKVVGARYNKKLVDLEVRRALRLYPYLRSIDRLEISPPNTDRQVKIDMAITLTDDARLQIGVTV